MKEKNNLNDLTSDLGQPSKHKQDENISKSDETKIKKRNTWKVFRIILWSLLSIPLLVIVFCSGVLIMDAMSSSNNIAGNFQYKPCVERYGLMEPAMQKGDLLFFEKTEISELEVGDVIAYHLDGNDSVGRIISIDSAGLTVKTDKEPACNEVYVPNECVQGKWYGFRIPIIGWVVLFIQDSWWVLIVIPSMIEMICILVRLLKKKSSTKELQTNNGE